MSSVPSAGGPYSPYVTPPPVGPQPPAKQKNVLGLIALIASVVGFVFACIPGALIVGWVLLPIAFILGIVGLFLSGKAKGTSIAAVIISIVGAVVGAVVFFTVVADAFDDAFGGSDLTTSLGTATEATSPETTTEENRGGAEAGSRENPLPIGQTVSNQDWEITLGPPREAWAEIAAENQFNDPPEAGMEYRILPVTATYTGDDTGNALFGIRVNFVGVDNRTYDGACGVIPDPVDDVGELYKGGVAQGNKCVAVPAGAEGLWAVTTGFVGDPIFFTAK